MDHALRRHGLAVALLLTLVFSLYGRSADFHFVNWDDRHHVYRNVAVTAPQDQPWQDVWFGRNIGYPLPLTLATWRLDQLRAQGLPADTPTMSRGKVFHQSQLLYLALLALALYTLVLAGMKTREGTRPLLNSAVAGVAAALMLSHPVMVEPLVWVTGRKDLLAVLFGALALRSLWLASDSDHKQWRWAGVWALLALASKPTAVWLAPMCGYAWWARARGGARNVAATWTVAVLAVAAGVVVWVGSGWHADVGGLQETSAGGAVTRALRATAFHLKLMIWPTALRAKYVLQPNMSWGAEHIIALGAGLALMATALHRRTRNTPWGWGAAAALCAWLPVSNLVPLKRHVADSYVAMPWVALSWALTLGVVHRLSRRAALFVLAAIWLALAPWTTQQIETWRDSTTLWTQVMRYEQTSPQVCRMAGHGLHVEARSSEALALWEGCAERFGPPLFANNLSQVALQSGDLPRAKRWIDWQLRNNPRDPRALRAARRLEALTAR